MNKTRISPRRLVSAVALVSILGLAACGSDDTTTDSVASDSVTTDSGAGTEAAADGVSIADAWSRQPADGQTTSAVYGVVTNGTDEAVTAISATTSVDATVEIHETTMNDEGQMSMSEKEDGFEIPAGASFTFEPGGPHIMLLDIDSATYPDSVDVTLEFDNGMSLDFAAEVREIAGGAMDMDGDMDGEMDGDMDGEMEMDDSMGVDEGMDHVGTEATG